MPRPSCLDENKEQASTILPLAWPEELRHPSTIQRFLMGVPFLGPDRCAYRTLRKQVASRPQECLTLWPQDEQAVLVRDKILDLLEMNMKWGSRKFIPDDPCDILFFRPTVLCQGEEAMFAFWEIGEWFGSEKVSGLLPEFRHMSLGDMVNRLASATAAPTSTPKTQLAR